LSIVTGREVVVHRDGPAEVRWSFDYVAHLVYWHGYPYGGCFFLDNDGQPNTGAWGIAHELASYPKEIQDEWRSAHPERLAWAG
jgi:hypothetical protein